MKTVIKHLISVQYVTSPSPPCYWRERAHERGINDQQARASGETIYSHIVALLSRIQPFYLLYMHTKRRLEAVKRHKEDSCLLMPDRPYRRDRFPVQRASALPTRVPEL